MPDWDELTKELYRFVLGETPLPTSVMQGLEARVRRANRQYAAACFRRAALFMTDHGDYLYLHEEADKLDPPSEGAAPDPVDNIHHDNDHPASEC